MTLRQIWEDKLPEDKVKYYNRTRMSLDLFCRKVGIAQPCMLRELEQYGYVYNERERLFELDDVCGGTPCRSAINRSLRY